jgi:hypothetical protein
MLRIIYSIICSQIKKITFQKKYTISGTFGILAGMRDKALISGTVGHPNDAILEISLYTISPQREHFHRKLSML